MARKYRPVADRQKSLEPVDSKASFTLGGVQGMYGRVGGLGSRTTVAGRGPSVPT